MILPISIVMIENEFTFMHPHYHHHYPMKDLFDNFTLFYFQNLLTKTNYFMFTLEHGNCIFYLSSIENWDVSKITTMSNLFYNRDSCNLKIGSWNVSNVFDFVSQSIVHSANFQEQRKHASTLLLLPSMSDCIDNAF